MGKIAVLFAGQGAQYPGMGRDLYETSPAAKEVFSMGDSVRPGIVRKCFEADREILSLTENTQPCLFLCDLACARAAEEAGIHFDVAAGFSLGEIAALAYAGVMSDKNAFNLVCRRGEAMSKCSDMFPGSMCAVLKLSPEKVEELASGFEYIYPVNYNCPGQIAVAGSEFDMDDFSEAVKAAGGRAVRLSVSGAFHTPFMKETTNVLREFLKDTKVSSPNMPLYSNYTAEPYPSDEDEIRETIAVQASNSVKWEAIIRNMAASGVDTFVEVGAGKTLSGFVSRTVPNARIFNVGDAESLAQTVAAIKENADA